MYGILIYKDFMEMYFPINTWFIISAILTPIGYVFQDVVADAMTVEVVEPKLKNNKTHSLNKEIKAEHTLVQLYGRFAIIFGGLVVGLINLYVFNNLEDKSNSINEVYANIYLIALAIPFISVSGVFFSRLINKNNKNHKPFKINRLDYQIFLGSCFFVFFAIFLGTLNFSFSRELVLITSLLLISIIIHLLIKDLSNNHKYTIIGTAIIIFVYRAIPSPGAGLNWFEIDILGFDQSFFAVLSIISSAITLLGMFIFRKFMINTSIAKLFAILSILSALLYLPSLLMYYEIHKITSLLTNGIVDARFIAILNTAVDSPLSQVAMIPLLAWIAKNAPIKYKATFFAVFASFTNLALSARELFTSYLNKVFVIKREIVDKKLHKVIEEANYTDLDNLLISIIIITLFVPLLTIIIIQKSKLRSSD